MKILISADMEGVTGVTTWDQVTPGHAEYARFRGMMTGDVNAAVRGAFDGGAKEVVVADGHWNGSNILVEELDPRARLSTGAPSPLSMMQGIDESTDGVVFIGYHARHGSPQAVLDHTWSSTCVHNVWVNGALAGEYTLNAALAGQYGVPVLLASGDQTACAQISEVLGQLATVVVKRASGRFSAECLPPPVTQDMIARGVKEAVERRARKESAAAFRIKMPVQMTVELQTSDMADRASMMPGVARDGLRLSFSGGTVAEAYLAFRALVALAYPR